MIAAIIFIFGICIGSFLNVVIYRLPNGKSIAAPPSHCPGCGYFLKPADLLPVLSWLWLKGRCRNCYSRISLRYPVIELFTGVLFVVCYKFSFAIEQFVVLALFMSLLLAITMIDFDLQIIPDELLAALAVLAIAANGYAAMATDTLLGKLYVHGLAPVPFTGWKEMLIGAAAGFGVMLAIFLASRGGMGGGDVKFAAVLGMWLGWKLVLLSLLFAFILGGLTGIILLATSVKKRKDPVPFGPFMAFSAAVFAFFGQQLLCYYQSFC